MVKPGNFGLLHLVCHFTVPLRPTRFDILPNTPSSKKKFKHWFRTFEYYLEVLPKEGLDKLKVLINFISPKIFEYISDCDSHNSAIETINNIYILNHQTLYLHVIYWELVGNDMVKPLMNTYKHLKFLQKTVILKLSQLFNIKINL